MFIQFDKQIRGVFEAELELMMQLIQAIEEKQESRRVRWILRA